MHFSFYNFKKEIVFVIGATPFDACDDVNANEIQNRAGVLLPML